MIVSGRSLLLPSPVIMVMKRVLVVGHFEFLHRSAATQRFAFRITALVTFK
jgi:hypothetical protein